MLFRSARARIAYAERRRSQTARDGFRRGGPAFACAALPRTFRGILPWYSPFGIGRRSKISRGAREVRRPGGDSRGKIVQLCFVRPFGSIAISCRECVIFESSQGPFIPFSSSPSLRLSLADGVSDPEFEKRSIYADSTSGRHSVLARRSKGHALDVRKLEPRLAGQGARGPGRKIARVCGRQRRSAAGRVRRNPPRSICPILFSSPFISRIPISGGMSCA